MKEKLDFFDPSKKYVDFLQKAEIEKRGFTRIPNAGYEREDRKEKFLTGIVLKINEINYYAPVSSYKKKQADNILIKFDDQAQTIGSIRFNYMYPIPKSEISTRNISKEPDKKRKRFLQKQLIFVTENQEKIKRMASVTYNRVCNGKTPWITENACDFKYLEEMCKEYEKIKEEEKTNLEQILKNKLQKDNEIDQLVEKNSITEDVSQLIEDAIPDQKNQEIEQKKEESKPNLGFYVQSLNKLQVLGILSPTGATEIRKTLLNNKEDIPYRFTEDNLNYGIKQVQEGMVTKEKIIAALFKENKPVEFKETERSSVTPGNTEQVNGIKENEEKSGQSSEFYEKCFFEMEQKGLIQSEIRNFCIENIDIIGFRFSHEDYSLFVEDCAAGCDKEKAFSALQNCGITHSGYEEAKESVYIKTTQKERE